MVDADPKLGTALQASFTHERLAYLLIIVTLAGAAVQGWRRSRDALGRLNAMAIRRTADFASAGKWLP